MNIWESANNLFRGIRGVGGEKNNPVMDVFDELGEDDINIEDLAITNQKSRSGNDKEMGYDTQNYYYQRVYAPLSTNKIERIRQYRLMSRYPELLECLEIIADEVWFKDENEKYATLDISDNVKGMNDDRKKILNEEWESYFSMFNIKKNGFKYVKTFLHDGELAWENVIDPAKKELGIIGVNYIQTDRYEFLRDLVRNINIGIAVKKEAEDAGLMLSQTHSASRPAFTDIDRYSSSASYSSAIFGEDLIPILWSQLTYVNTGDYDANELIVYPLIDRSREAYHQLSMLHDASVILRVVRAPERLIFNIDVGKMTDKKAKMKVKEFIRSMTSKKVADSSGIKSNKYDPHSMLESYYFWKSSDGGGTDVETLGSTATYDQMDDIEYFLKRLYKTLKVPFSRWQQAENTMERDETITYEEYSFAKFIIRIQEMFASGFGDGFTTHLKLRGLWEKFGLKDGDLAVQFTAPILYELYQQQKLLQIKMEIYDLQADKEEFSHEMAQRDILGWDDDKIKENKELRRAELLEEAMITHWTDKIEENGPLDIDSPVKWNEPPEDEEGDEDDFF